MDGDALYQLPVARKPRVGATHHVGHDVDDPGGHEVSGSEALRDEHGPADEPSQHIATALVGGKHAV